MDRKERKFEPNGEGPFLKKRLLKWNISPDNSKM